MILRPDAGTRTLRGHQVPGVGADEVAFDEDLRPAVQYMVDDHARIREAGPEGRGHHPVFGLRQLPRRYDETAVVGEQRVGGVEVTSAKRVVEPLHDIQRFTHASPLPTLDPEMRSFRIQPPAAAVTQASARG